MFILMAIFITFIRSERFDQNYDLYCDKSEFDQVSPDLQYISSFYVEDFLVTDTTNQLAQDYVLINTDNNTDTSTLASLNYDQNSQINFRYRVISLKKSCQFNYQMTFQTEFINNVASITIYSDTQQQIKLNNDIYFSSFDTITIKNLTLIAQSFIQIQNLLEQETAFFLESIILDGLFSICLTSTNLLSLRNIKIQNYNNNQMQLKNYFIINNSQMIPLNLQIHNLSIQSSTFQSNKDIFLNIPQNNIGTNIKLEIISIKDCIFQGYTLFQDNYQQNLTANSKWVIQYLEVLNSTFQQSSIFKIHQSSGIYLKDCRFSKIMSTQRSILIQSNEVGHISLQNLSFSDGAFNDSSFLNCSYFVKMIVSIQNLSFKSQVFFNSSFVILQPQTLSPNNNYKQSEAFLNFDSISLTNCSFSEYVLFLDHSTLIYSMLSHWVIQNLQIDSSRFFNSSMLLQINSALNVQISNLNLTYVISSLASVIIQTNTIQLHNVNFRNGSFNASIFLQSHKTPPERKVILSIPTFQISNLTFEYSYCSIFNCIMQLSSSTPTTSHQLLPSVILKNITIKNNNFKGQYQDDAQFLSTSMISMTNIQNLTLHGFQSLHNQGQKLVYINGKNFLKSIGIRFANFIDINCDGALFLQSQKFSADYATSQQKLHNSQFDSYCISIQDFSDQVNFSQIFINKNYALNQPIILIKGYERTIMMTNETIVIRNLIVQENNLEITSGLVSTSIIKIVSSQKSQIFIEDTQFISNHMHFPTQHPRISATNLIVDSEFANVTLKNVTFQDNRATASSYGSIFIVADDIKIINCLFRQFNQLYSLWKEYYSQNALQTKFRIQCKGGHAFLQAQFLLILNSQFLTSYSKEGGLMIKTKNPSKIQIQDSQFQNGFSDVDEVSKGGCIYIDASLSETVVSLNNVSMQSCISRSLGGCIYMVSRYQSQSIFINNSEFIDCLSIMGSLFYGDFKKSENLLSIQNIEASIDNQRQQAFFQDIDRIQEYERYNLQSFSSLFYLLYVDLTLHNSSFHDLTFQGVLQLQFMTGIRISQLNIYGILLIFNPIISITFRSNSSLRMNGINFYNINSTNLSNIQGICSDPLQQLQVNLITNQINEIKQYKQQYADDELPILHSYNDLYSNQCKIWSYLKEKLNEDIELVKIVTTESLQFASLINFNISNINCSDCNNGLISILSYTSPKQFFIDIMRCENVTLGTYGCLAVTSGSTFQQTQSLARILEQTNFIDEIMRRKFFLNNSVFKNIQATIGAGVTIIGVDSFILGCQFLNNHAVKGGGLYFATQFQITVIDTQFDGNIAQYGGALYSNQGQLGSISQLNDTFINNKGLMYGSNLVENPCKIAVSIDGGKTLLRTQRITQSPYSVKDQVFSDQMIYFPSGQKIGLYGLYDDNNKINQLNLTLRVINLNSFDEPQLNLSGYTCTIYSRESLYSNFTNQSLTNNVQQWNSTSQAFNFDQLIISFDPVTPQDQQLQLQITCDSIYTPIFDTKFPFSVIDYNKNYKFLMQIRTFSCQQGEVINNQKCPQCDPSLKQYQVQKQFTKCSILNEITTISSTISELQLRNGYWRPHTSDDSIEPCFNFPSNCLGGWEVGDNSCAEGHIGALCESCDLSGTRNGYKFAKEGQYTCSSCSDIQNNILVVFAVTLFTFLYIIFSVYLTYQAMQIFIQCLMLERMKIMFHDNNESAVLIKIFTNYIKILSAITTFRLRLPTSLVKTVNNLGNPITSTFFSLDCFLVDLTDIHISYFRVMWAMFMPTLYLILFLLFYRIGVALNIFPRTTSIIYTAFLCIFIQIQPSMIADFIELTSSRAVSEIDWVQSDISIYYSSDEHQQWLILFALPGLLLWGLFLPLILFYCMWSKRDKLDSIKVRYRWGFLYCEYRKKSYFWEFVKIFQKEIIIIFLAQFQNLIVIKALLVFLTIFSYSQLAKKQQPYNTKPLNSLDQRSASVCYISILLGVLIYQCQQSSNQQEIIWIAYLLLGTINILFVLSILLHVAESILKEYEYKIDQVRDIINNKFPNIELKYPKLGRLLRNQQIIRSRNKQLWGILRIEVWKTMKSKSSDQQNKQAEYCEQLDSKDEFQDIQVQDEPILSQTDSQLIQFDNNTSRGEIEMMTM